MLEQIGENTLIYLIVATFVICLTIVAIWLAFRPVRFWYWKKSIEFKILKNIDKKLSDQVDISQKIYLKIQVIENNLENQSREEKPKEVQKLKEKPQEEEQEKTETQKVQETESLNKELRDKDDVVFSKKGTAFNEKELYDIIKF